MSLIDVQLTGQNVMIGKKKNNFAKSFVLFVALDHYTCFFSQFLLFLLFIINQIAYFCPNFSLIHLFTKSPQNYTDFILCHSLSKKTKI